MGIARCVDLEERFRSPQQHQIAAFQHFEILEVQRDRKHTLPASLTGIPGFQGAAFAVVEGALPELETFVIPKPGIRKGEFLRLVPGGPLGIPTPHAALVEQPSAALQVHGNIQDPALEVRTIPLPGADATAHLEDHRDRRGLGWLDPGKEGQEECLEHGARIRTLTEVSCLRGA